MPQALREPLPDPDDVVEISAQIDPIPAAIPTSLVMPFCSCYVRAEAGTRTVQSITCPAYVLGGGCKFLRMADLCRRLTGLGPVRSAL